ncbi:MAG: DMT family transporter [Eubacteriales bacterium]|nr:DMT family transporter [Eubacteriales bacterium]
MEKKHTIHRASVLFVVFLGMISGATASLFIRYGTAPMLVLAAYRKTIVTVMLLPMVLLHHRDEWKKLKLHTVLWCVLAGIFLAIHFFTYFMSVKYTTIAASNVLAGTEILFVSVFMFAAGKETFNRMNWLSIAIALIGGIVVSMTGSNDAALNGPLGNICGVICAVALAGYSLVGSKVRQANLSNTLFTFIAYGASAIVLDGMVICSGYSLFGYDPINYLVAIGMAVFCSLLSHSLYTWSLKYISPTLLAIFKILSPVPTALLGFLVLSEIPSWNQIIGGIVVILGIMLYIRSKNPEAETPREHT